ncbi:MAG: hypothetical protein JXR73_13645 [Candidatus Omnitrophica bacterium]|nr:hypothetical protein [Candidatus Omnitrophota bacterium]
MTNRSIDRLIINSPYEESRHYWGYDREAKTFSLHDGRRPAGYVIASPGSQSFNDPGVFVEIPHSHSPLSLPTPHHPLPTIL